jgi:hypothetical protein
MTLTQHLLEMPSSLHFPPVSVIRRGRHVGGGRGGDGMASMPEAATVCLCKCLPSTIIETESNRQLLENWEEASGAKDIP